jgi:hypothetical protein
MNQHRQFLRAQIIETALDSSFVVADDRIPIRGLIASRGKTDQGEWVVLGRCAFLFQETTKDARF